MAKLPDFQKKRVEVRKWATDVNDHKKTAKAKADEVLRQLDYVKAELKVVLSSHDQRVQDVIDQSVDLHKRYGELAEMQKQLSDAEKRNDQVKATELTKILEAKHATLERDREKMNRRLKDAEKSAKKLTKAKDRANAAYITLKT